MRHVLLSLCLAAPLMADPVPPAMFHCIDPNLKVTVWAASPMLRNPTNIDIDKAGRIWVAEGVNYRKHFDRQPEGDRIMVLEDTDGDGRADKSWPFVQEPFLRAPLGVAVIGNKVVVSMAPDLVVYTDKDGDLKFDPAKGDTREVLLTGFNGRNHDHSLHSVTVGPDGKWYFSCGNCGAKFTDKSGKTFRIAAKQNVSWWPKDPARPDWDPNEIAGQKSDDGRVYVGGFIARMDPDGSNVEILAHNLRNSYENCVTSFGDIFASDNDDQPACRVFWVLEGGNYGFASADGQRTWLADRRPGQSIATATWRQEDPGVAPAGDVYGGGSPTGCVFYENGALDATSENKGGARLPPSRDQKSKSVGSAAASPHLDKVQRDGTWEGTLLVCEPGRNVIFGYKPQPEGAGWKLERFDFLTTNKEGSFTGTDFTGGNKTAKAEDVKTLFRPSDVAVGPDGAIYVADWFDPRVGGHADMDDSLSGTIYRIAPKGFKPKVPKFDLATVEGAIEALKSPAVHVRTLGAMVLTTKEQEPEARGNEIHSAMKSALVNAPPFILIRALHVLTSRGEMHVAKGLITHGQEERMWRAIHYIRERGYFAPPSDSDDSLGENLRKNQWPLEPTRSSAHFVSWFRAMRDLRKQGPIELMAEATRWHGFDPSSINAWHYGSEGKEEAIYASMLVRNGNPSDLEWSIKFAALVFQIHPPQSIPAFKTRALSTTLPEKARLDALTAVGFNETADAARAMLEAAQKTEGRVKETALWWLVNRKDSTWKSHNLNAALKERGIYDPDKINLLPMPLPEPVAPAFSIADATKLPGDAKRGEVVSQKCFVCHKIGANGVEYGPDLSMWGRAQSTEVILRSLIEPDADIAHGFAGTEIETTDGLTIAGLLVSDSDPLIIRSAGGVSQMVPLSKIKSKANLQRSLMMSATQLGLTAQEAADVAAYLKAQK